MLRSSLLLVRIFSGEPSAGIRDDQPYAFEPTGLEVTEEAASALQILLLALSDPEDFPESIGPKADRN